MALEDVSFTHMTRDEAFELLDRLARGIALVGGPSCEALVQEIVGKTFYTLSIYNGHVSGRQVGSTLSVYGSETIADDGDEEFEPFVDINCQAAHTSDGRRIKSSTWLVRGEGYVMGLGVNTDVTELSRAAEMLSAMASVGAELRDTLYPAGRVSEDAEVLIGEQLKRLGKPAEALSRGERIELVRLLDARGFFGFQRSAPALASRLGVSKSTVYNYLKEIS